jgi:hypothetical protein
MSILAAEPIPYTVIVPEVEVRSGPSPEYYSTSKLRRGDTVQVVREENKSWLAIKPPLPDSFSWINIKHVQQSGPAAVVLTDGAPVRVGSRLRNEPPTVEWTKLGVGTQLIVIGQPQIASDGTWLPITPAPSEVRFVPAEGVRPSSSLQQIAATPPGATPAPQPAPASATTAATPLLARAELAERAGKLAEAQGLYEELAREVMASNHDLAVHYLNRSQLLRNSQLATGKERPAPMPTASSGQAVLASAPRPRGGVGSQYCYVPDGWQPVRLIPPPSGTVPPPTGPTSQSYSPAQAAPVGQWYGPGRLYRTAFFVEGKQTYGLEPVNGGQRLYVTAGGDLKLDPWVEKRIYLFGPVRYHGELRTYHMTAAQVVPAR